MDWVVWRLRVLQSAVFLAGSVYFLSLHIIAHAGLVQGKVHPRSLRGCIYGVLGCSLAATFHVSVLCCLFKKARAERAREQQQQLPPPEMDMV